MLFEPLIDNINNLYYKVRQLLQNETDNSYQEICYKVHQVLQSVTEDCYKVR